MFVATPGNQVLAIDAKTGNAAVALQAPAAGRFPIAAPDQPRRRALGRQGLLASADAVLVALDAKTGKEVWTAKVADYKNGYYMSMMPLVADGKVMVGTSGGELGVRGFVAAFDAETGKEVWRTYTVPARASPAARPGRRATNGRPAADQSG